MVQPMDGFEQDDGCGDEHDGPEGVQPLKASVERTFAWRAVDPVHRIGMRLG